MIMMKGPPPSPLALLRSSLGDGARFRDGQREAIEELVEKRGRLALIQRTGWGKSLVYFLATRLLRDAGAGPTVLISPLLALMRNQIDMARRFGCRAETLNSTNVGDWREVEENMIADRVDLLYVSPERFANPRFRAFFIDHILKRIGLFVIDEAHCVSDWGHDFRPDYRRLGAVIDTLPPRTPVLATTATANHRVEADIFEQLGAGTKILRGALARPNLRLQNLIVPQPEQRLAWLSEHVPRLPYSGVVYCLTVRDVQRVAEFLAKSRVQALPYWGGMEHERRLEAETALSRNEIKCLVATSALGMGYDKPDLGFVIHYQSPSSLLAYYQQVGRAGRAIDEACGVLLFGAEDESIHEYFHHTALPPEQDFAEVLDFIESRAGDGARRGDCFHYLNIPPKRIETCLKILEVDGALAFNGAGWTATGRPWKSDSARRRALLCAREAERRRVREYAKSGSCLMRFLVEEMNGEMEKDCGLCAVCAGKGLTESIRRDTLSRARRFIEQCHETIAVRKQWPPNADGVRKRIPEEERLEPGWALCVYDDPGLGKEVARAKYAQRRFGSALIRASARLIEERWRPDPPPEWIAFIPSLNRPKMMEDFAAALGKKLALPVRAVVLKTVETPPQKIMDNAWRQAANAWAGFSVDEEKTPSGACLLIDDIVDSGWTLTTVGIKLRRAGVEAVHPFALASARMKR